MKKLIIEIAKNSKLVPFLVGKHGEGKTSLIKDIAAENNLTLSILNLSAIEAADFCGMPYIDNNQTKTARPAFFDADLIFLDEIDSVRDSAVKAALKSLLMDRAINGNKLNDTTLLMAAGNGTNGDYDTQEFDAALGDRLVSIPFEYTIEQKIDYLTEKYPNHNLVKFAAAKTEIFGQLSTRRIEEACKVGHDALKFFLGSDIFRAYNQFISLNMVKLSDIENDLYDFSKLTVLSKSSLIQDISAAFYTLENSGLNNINAFINQLNAEEKANYFSKLKKLCLKDSEKFKARANELNALGFFSGQAKFLKELI